MRVLVCGSRTFEAVDPIHTVLNSYYAAAEAQGDDFTVVEGGARGADAIASEWAMHVAPDNHEQYPANWEMLGRRAGSLRNQQMLDEGKPDVVWAFVNKPLAESRGTADMVRRARAAGIPTYVVECAQ